MKLIELQYKGSTISCHIYGIGPIPVFCLHGYGENAMSFALFDDSTDYTFYCIDLPLHGNTKWIDPTVSTNDIIAIKNMLLNEEEYVLMGYSMGGRIALAIYEQEPDYIKKMILLAPDGLVMNPWYRLSTQTFLGNKIFKWTMKQPAFFLKSISILSKTSLLNKSSVKFVNHYLQNRNARTALYERWTAFAKIKPNLQRAQQLIILNQTNIHLFYGKYDRIIHSTDGVRFIKPLNTARITILTCGHHLITEQNKRIVLSSLAKETA